MKAKLIGVFIAVLVVLAFTVLPVIAATTINYDTSLYNPYTWRPCIWRAGSYIKTSWDYIEPTLAYQSYYGDGWEAKQWIDRSSGYWEGVVDERTGDGWVCVDAKQGQFPKSSWNPCPLKEQDYTLTLDSNGHLPAGKVTLTILFMRSDPVWRSAISNPFISQFPSVSSGVDVWFDLDPDGMTYNGVWYSNAWVYSDPSPTFPPKLVVIDFFVDRWIAITPPIWYHVGVNEQPYGYTITTDTPYDRDVHGLFVVAKPSQANTWYQVNIDVASYWNVVANWIDAVYGYTPSTIKIKCVAPFVEAIGGGYSAVIGYVELKVN